VQHCCIKSSKSYLCLQFYKDFLKFIQIYRLVTPLLLIGLITQIVVHQSVHRISEHSVESTCCDYCEVHFHSLEDGSNICHICLFQFESSQLELCEINISQPRIFIQKSNAYTNKFVRDQKYFRRLL